MSPRSRRAPIKAIRFLQKARAKIPVFDVQVFLDTSGVARKVKELKEGEVVYSQGNLARSVMYLQEGGVKLTVVNEVGREAVVAILGPGDFFGEGCLAGQPVRMGTATAVTHCKLLVIDRNEMLKVLHEQHALSVFDLMPGIRVVAGRKASGGFGVGVQNETHSGRSDALVWGWD